MLKYAIIGTATRATLPMLSTTCCPCIMKSTHTCTPDAKRQTSNISIIGWEDGWTLKQAVTSTARARRPAHVSPATKTGIHTCAAQHRVPGQDRNILSMAFRQEHSQAQTGNGGRRQTRHVCRHCLSTRWLDTVPTRAGSRIEQHSAQLQTRAKEV